MRIYQSCEFSNLPIDIDCGVFVMQRFRGSAVKSLQLTDHALCGLQHGLEDDTSTDFDNFSVDIDHRVFVVQRFRREVPHLGNRELRGLRQCLDDVQEGLPTGTVQMLHNLRP